MNFIIKRDVLLDGVQKTLGIVNKKTTLPILNNIFLEAEEDYIRIVATDREISLISRYEADVTERGKITLSAKKLYEITREINGDDVHVQVDEKNIITLSCQKAVYRIMGVSSDDYPSIVAEENTTWYQISGRIIKNMIRKVFFAMSTDELRRNLNGLFLHTGMEEDQSYLYMVSADGHRLAFAKEKLDNQDFLDLSTGIIIPRKGVVEIRRVVESDPENIFIGLMGQMFLVQSGNVILKVSLINAEYPDYKRVIPTEKGQEILLHRTSFLHVLRRMFVVVSSEEFRTVLLTVHDNQMLFQSKNADVGEANEDMDITYSGNRIEVGYNIDYLIDAADVIDEENIYFEIGEGRKPGLIRSMNKEEYLCVIMPLMI